MADAAEPGVARIRVLYGGRAAVLRELARAAPPSQPTVWLASDPEPLSAWQGTRQVVGFAADALARGAFEAMLARHGAVLSVLYPELALALTEDERDAAVALRADLRSHDTHSMASWQPLIQAAAALLADALEAARAVIVVPELANLDAPTSHALREAFRTRGAQLAGLWVGHDPGFAGEPARVWGVPVIGRVGEIRARLCDYQLHPGCAVSWLVPVGAAGRDGAPGTSPAAPDRTAPGGNAWSAPSPDAIALAALSASGTPSPATLHDALAAMRWAAEVYAWSVALRIGVWIEPHREHLAAAAQAEHAWMTAVAATNAHFVDWPTPGYDEHLYAMYERAIALSADPVALASLSVRLAFAGVDRGASPVDDYLERAAARVGELELPWASYHGGWLAIANALHALHLGDLPAADRSLHVTRERFFELERHATSALRPRQLDKLQRELSCARFMVLGHGAIQATSAGELATAARWLAQAEHDGPRVPPVTRFEVLHWVSLRQVDEDWTVLYERSCAGVRDAEQSWDSRPWSLYRAVAAECTYRMGMAAEAAEHCRRLLAAEAHRLPGAVTLWNGDLRAFAVSVFLRAGDPEAALELAPACLADPAGSSAPEVQSIAAMALAARGATLAAQAAIDRAIDLAVESGNQSTMLRVATAAAQVLWRLGDRAEAARALGSAWELAEDEPGRFSEAVLAADCLRLCVVASRIAGPTDALLSRACALVAPSLGHGESWWDIAELLDALAGWCARGEALSPAMRSALAAVRGPSRHRADWRAQLARLP